MEILKIPLSLVTPSPMNPRKTFDEGELQELAENIEKQGLLQPITVRAVKHPDDQYGDRPDKYEVVCGERRFRAFRRLSEKWSAMDCVAPKGQTYDRFAEIPAIVREMNDEEAFDAMITENLQRKDVDPMEEAFAFGQLIERGSTTEEVALRFGKSIRFVRDRVKLNTLIPELMVAVKDGTMSLAAAMLISKLDQEQQRDFFKKHKDDLSKWNAERYVNNLFMYIRQAVWSKDKPDFAGTTCGTSCQECQYNTCNHGCLFYEMKTDAENGKCTSRERFMAKTEEYAFHVIEQYSQRLVKVGEPLVKGKVVVGVSIPTYIDERDKTAMRAVEDKVRAAGYEVFNCDNYFDHRVSYDIDDERTLEFLDNDTAYMVLDLYNYTALHPTLRAYYLKRGDKQTNCTEVGTPSKVVELLGRYKREDEDSSYTVALASAIGANAEATINALDETEKMAVCAAMLVNNYNFRHKNGYDLRSDKELLAYIRENINTCFNSVLRAYLIESLRAGNNAVMHIVEPLLSDLGRMWCEEACDKAVKDKDNKRKKKLNAITKQLKELGYGTDGKPLPANN